MCRPRKTLREAAEPSEFVRVHLVAQNLLFARSALEEMRRGGWVISTHTAQS